MGETRTRPTVVVTDGEGREGALAEELRRLGAHVIALPTFSIEPPEDFHPLDRALAEIDRFDWIVFTSRHAVEAVLSRESWTIARHKALPGLRVAAVGQATAARLSELGVTPDLVPRLAGGASLAATMSRDADASGGSLARRSLAGVRVLWPRSDIARRELPDALREAGAEVVEPIVYRTVSAGSEENAGELLTRLQAGEIDAVTFMSPSSARGLSAMIGSSDLAIVAEHAVIASLGPTTSDALRDLGAQPVVESAGRTAEDLARTLAAFLEARASRDPGGPR